MSTPAPSHGDAMTAALLQISGHAERLAALDQREADHYQQIADQLAALARQLDEVIGRATDMDATITRHAAIVSSLSGLDEQIAALTSRLTSVIPASSENPDEAIDRPYQPAPAPQWWKLSEHDRAQAIAQLQAWVGDIYQPGYGHLASLLGDC